MAVWTDPASHIYVTGEVVTPATMNTFIKDDLLALWQSNAANTGIIGGIPPASAHIYAQSGTTVGIPNGTGDIVINLPRSFGSGLVTVLATPGDLLATDKPYFTAIRNSVLGLGAIDVKLYDYTGTPYTSGTFRVNWVAWGWD